MATINHKELEQVLQEIQSPVKRNKQTTNGYGYYSIDMYENCLKEILGMSHYVATYKDIQHIVLPGGQVLLIGTCSLSFIDDEGKICFTTNGIGSYSLAQSTSADKFINLSTCGYNLQAEAFKSACRSLQMFGIHGNNDSSEEKISSQGKSSSDKKNDNDEKPEVKNVLFYTSGAVEVVREDKRTHKPIYKVYGNIVSDGVTEQNPSAILFYPNMYKKQEELLNQFITNCSDGQSHSLKAQVTETSSYAYEDMPQYIFKGFWR